MLQWPPEFDAIKIVEKSLYCRVRETEIWLEVNSSHLAWLEELAPSPIRDIILAWLL
jgi:hypothetical protein